MTHSARSIRFDVITAFPEAFSYLDASMLKRARAGRLIDVRIHNLRNFARSKHKNVDDKPYGGGPGMVFKIEPLMRAVGSIFRTAAVGTPGRKKTLLILFSATGKQFNQKMAREFARKYGRIGMICGHYEGIDDRARQAIRHSGFALKELSVGPYVLTGGELPAMVVIDAVSRYVPGVLGKASSLEESRLGLGIPVYTRPDTFIWRGKTYKVPWALISGNHQRISEWRNKYRK